jgi:lipopolysaccharide/colanic/teichoic acid biosynthesis glycosyltransferase
MIQPRSELDALTRFSVYRDAVKPVLDVACAAVVLAFTWPLGVALAVATAASGVGWPVFTQVRPGKAAKPFRIYKFKTMRDGSAPDAQRLTAFGKWLRSTSLDEWPQLFNILRGEMSFVGPRPLLMEYLPHYTARQSLRHAVRPGLTGLAQVTGLNTVRWPERLELDAQYSETQSFGLDCWIVAQTLVLVLSGKGITAPGEATMPTFTEWLAQNAPEKS